MKEIDALYREHYAAHFAHAVDRDDAEARERYNDVLSRLAQYDLLALRSEVRAQRERDNAEYEAAELMLGRQLPEARQIDIDTAQRRKNFERHGIECVDSELASWLDGTRTLAGIEGLHYQRRRPMNAPPPDPPPLTPEEKAAV